MNTPGRALFATVAAAGLAAVLAAQAGSALEIPALRANIDIEGRPVAIDISGSVSADAPNAARVHLDIALGALQRQIVPILQSQWKQDNRCGERITLLDAALTPDPPAARLLAHIHFEKWGCAKAFGKEITKKLLAGDGTVDVRLTPSVEAPSASPTVHLEAEVLTLEANGELGELLRSGSFGDALRDKIRRTLAEDIEKAARFDRALPPALREVITLQFVRFAKRGESDLYLQADAAARLDPAQIQSLTGK